MMDQMILTSVKTLECPCIHHIPYKTTAENQGKIVKTLKILVINLNSPYLKNTHPKPGRLN